MRIELPTVSWRGSTRWLAIGLLGAVVVAVPAVEAQRRPTSRPSARTDAVDRSLPKRTKVVRVRGVRWQPSLDAALAAAAKAKPVVWFRVLGELEGFA